LGLWLGLRLGLGLGLGPGFRRVLHLQRRLLVVLQCGQGSRVVLDGLLG